MPHSTTVIAALKFQGGVVIAADSQASDMAAGVRWPVEKLERLGNHPCVVGFSGSVGKATQARSDLAEKTLHANTFAKVDRVQNALGGVLTTIYEKIKNESYPPMLGVPNIALWGLVGLWADGEPRILEFEINGDSSYHEHFHAIGSGANKLLTLSFGLSEAGGSSRSMRPGPRWPCSAFFAPAWTLRCGA